MIRDGIEPHTRAGGSRRRSTREERGNEGSEPPGDPSRDGERQPVWALDPIRRPAGCAFSSRIRGTGRPIACSAACGDTPAAWSRPSIGSMACWDAWPPRPCRDSWIASTRCRSPSRTGDAERSTRRTAPRRRATSGRFSTSASARGSTRSSPRGIPRSSSSRRTRAGSPSGASPCRFRNGRCCDARWTSTPWSRPRPSWGFPVRVPIFPATPEDAVDLAKRLGYPVVVKPRFSVRGRGSYLVTDPAKLEATIRRVQPTFGMPMLQEWIPGGLDQRVSVAVTLDRMGRPITVHARRHLRTVLRSFVSLALCSGVLHGDARGRRCHPPAASPRLRGARSSAGQGGSP